MAVYQSVSVTVSANADGTYNLQVGPNGWTVDPSQILAMLSQADKRPEYLLHQIVLGLDAAGYTVSSFLALTAAQKKAAIQALTLKW